MELDALYNDFYEAQAGVDQFIDPIDDMLGLNGSIPHYFSVGQSMMRCIRLALLAAHKPPSTVERILDMACGHGRMLRVVRAAYPKAEIVACDINIKGVEFCAKQYKAIPLISNTEPDDIPFELKGFDLIYVASLFTHLPEPVVKRFMTRLNSILVQGGVLLFSTCGRHLASIYRPDPKHTQLLEDYERFGFGYEPYPGVAYENYGSTLAKPSWVMREMERFDDLRLLYFWERGVDNYQDMTAAIKL